ncbi:MAG: site-specific recombinase, DNA invertase Pin [Pseudonocardiales bacterium]|nr:MAG: site-specific recombinase, DNA invertase Pin [Pseudonocardiales bacterium]
MTTRAALYLRISEDRTGAGLGVARQREACEQLCTTRGWEIVQVLEENDTSASGSKPRLLFARLLAMIEAGEIDAVVVWHTDRLVRRIIELEHVIDLCEHNNVKLATVSGDLDLSTDAGRLNARILTSVARAEIERKSARQRAAFEQAAQAGKPTGGRRAFGYTVDALHLEPTEAPVVLEMFKRFASGDSLGELKRDLNYREIKTPRGHQWITGSVKQVLMNPRYAGLRGVRRVRLDERGRRMATENGNPRRDQWYDITGPAVWPGIVPEELWRACERRLRDPARAVHYSGSTQQYLLSGLAVCGVCGRKLKSGTQTFGRTLKCTAGPGRHVNRRAERIEEFVVAVIVERLRRPDAIDLAQSVGEGIDLRGLQEEARSLRANLTAYAEDAGSGRLTRQEFYTLREKAHARLAEIDTQLADAGRADVMAQFIDAIRDPAEVWDSCSLSTKRAVIDTLAVIRVMPGGVGRPKGGMFDPESVRIDWK